ncbi:MAG: hypothetical protein HQ514_06015 [Rhodospirillales bacterium]|nr:hypothetical protein [Rhodospirillales bacterium]
MNIVKLVAAVSVSIVMSAPLAVAGDQSMGFFITSVGMGKGANLGGLAGADAYCKKLAESAGSTGRTWRAYLSTQVKGKRGISARNRIGAGPWYNSKGELIASDLDQLHLNPNIVRRTALNEKGGLVNGRGDKPNRHDMLTGTKADGTAYFPWEKGDHTCSNWSSSDKGSASLGHHDRHGGGNTSWNAAHGSRGCSQEKLKSSGGAGLFYCFAAD